MNRIKYIRRELDKLQKYYFEKNEELNRIRDAYAIETDPSHKFKYEKQIKQHEKECNQLEQNIRQKEHQLAHPEQIPLFEWDYNKLPIDFSARIQFLTQYFIGRKKIVDEIDMFIEGHKSGYLLLVGETGIGKSALIAHLVQEQGYAHHFASDKQATAKGCLFLKSIVEQLRYKYLPDDENPLLLADWIQLFNQKIKEIGAEEKLIILVDALDEAERYGGEENLMKYLPESLPDNTYFILTSRPKLLHSEDIRILDSTVFEKYILYPLNQTDIKNYLIRRHYNSEWTSLIFEKTEGNPLYLYYLMQELTQGELTKGVLENLPQGLEKFYVWQWDNRIWIGDRETKYGREKLLSILFLIKQAINEKTLLFLSGYNDSFFRECIDPLRRFMRPGEICEIFHDSFKNFVYEQLKVTLSKYEQELIKHLAKWRDFSN